MNRRFLATAALALALCACGQQTDLHPAAGAAMPPPRYGTSEPATAEQLLTLEPQAVPERTVELRHESDERADDPFDLPPES